MLFRSTVAEGGMEVIEGTPINMHLGADTLFDVKTGMLAYRKVLLDGYLTASANVNSNEAYTLQTVVTQRISALGEPGSTPEKLAPGPGLN